MNIAYFGTPDFSARILDRLVTQTEVPIAITHVITQPDEPVGRKKILTPSPVKVTAMKYGLSVQTDRISAITPLLKSSPPDLAILFAYGAIIPQELLDIPAKGFWNIHPSLLPRYRGASPVAYPIMVGDAETGVTLMHMDAELDHGDIIAQTTHPISPHISRTAFTEELTDTAYNLLITQLKLLAHNEPIQRTVQNHVDATFTRRLNRKDGYVSWLTVQKALRGEPCTPQDFPQILQEYYRNDPATTRFSHAHLLIDAFMRAMDAWPGMWTTIAIDGQEKRLKILAGHLEPDRYIIEQVQLEGKQALDFETFKRGYGIRLS